MSDSSHPIDRIRMGLMAAIGGDPSDQTVPLIDEQMKVVERELEQVPTRAQERGQEFFEAAQEPMTAMLDTLKEYKAWLESAKEALEENEPTEIVAPYEASHDILPKLQKAVESYGAFYTSYGPNKTAVANNLAHTADAIRKDKMPKEAWSQYIDYYVGGLLKKLQTVKAVELPGKTYLGEGYQQTKSLLTNLRETPTAEEAKVNELLKSLDDALSSAEELEIFMSQSAEGPSPMPPTNVLVALMKRFKDGQYTVELAESALDDYSEMMDAFSETFESSVNEPIDSALVQEEIPRTLEALDAHYSGVEELIAAVEESSNDKIDEALEKVLATAIKIGESREVYITAAQHQNHIPCPACGRSNPPENRICEACGETLPRVEDPSALPSSTFSVLSSTPLEESQQLQMTENIAALFEACDNVADGHISLEAFVATVKEAQAGLREYSNELEDIAETANDPESFTEEQLEFWKTQHLPYLEEIAGAFQHGIKTTEDGLASMLSFVDTRDEQNLIDGVRMVWEGLGDVHRANLSLQTHSSMLDEFMDEIRTDQAVAAQTEN